MFSSGTESKSLRSKLDRILTETQLMIDPDIAYSTSICFDLPKMANVSIWNSNANHDRDSHVCVFELGNYQFMKLRYRCIGCDYIESLSH